MERLYRNQSGQYTKAQIKNWLSTQETYTLYKPSRRKFVRNPYILLGIDDFWQSDLIDLPMMSHDNRGNKYILVVIDAFSKFLWLVALKTKTGNEVTEKFESILKSQRVPRNLMTDKGFVSTSFHKLMKKYGINYYPSESPDTKASIAERVIRTIKGRIFRLLSSKKGKKKYVDSLQDIANSYNRSVHRSTGVSPIDVGPHNEGTIRQKLNKVLRQKKRNSKWGTEFELQKIGDHLKRDIPPTGQ